MLGPQIKLWFTAVRTHLILLFLVNLNAQANVLGTDAQTFNPTADGLSFVTVHSSQVLEPRIVNLGIFFNSASNTLSFLSRQDSQNLFNSRDRIDSMDFNAAIGLWPDWEVNISFPYLVRQEQSGCEACVFFKDPGFTETRLGIKNGNYRLGVWGLAWIFSINQNRIEDNPYSGRLSGLTKNLELALDRKLGAFLIAFNLGYRLREVGQRTSMNDYVARVPNQLIYSLGLSYYKSNWDSNLIAELFGSEPTQASPDGVNLSDRGSKALEMLLGIKHQWSHQLALHAGLGRQIFKGFGTPDLRGYVGLNFTFGFQKARSQVTQPNVANVKTFNLANMSFEFDSTILTSDSAKVFSEVMTNIAEMKEIEKIMIEGHTDSLGAEDYNLSLSQQRADSLKKRLQSYLQSLGRETNIEAQGFGETVPIESNANFQGRAANRRVVIKVVTKAK